MIKKYWMIVASKNHVETGKELGIIQACHGKAAPLKRMKNGDGFIFYSSKFTFEKGEPYQKFTAIGHVCDDEIYRVEMTPGFFPYRRNAIFYPNRDIEIRPLIEHLNFIQNKEKWGYNFRYGFFEIPQADYKMLADKMVLS